MSDESLADSLAAAEPFPTQACCSVDSSFMDRVCGEASRSNYNSAAHGEALDVILVRPDDEHPPALPSCSDFSVQFPHFRQASTVQVYLDGQTMPLLTMNYSSEKKQCRFVRGNSMKPDKATLTTLLQGYVVSSETDATNALTTPSKGNSIVELQYRLLDSRQKLLATAWSNLYLWNHDDSAVVCDIDGTITKSNARGALATIVLDHYDYVHDGVCDFLQKIITRHPNLRILYLTSRPISYAQKTRKFLTHLRQGESKLPRGPIFFHSGNLGEVLISELITKDMHEFKSDTLFRQVVLPIVAAGRSGKERGSMGAKSSHDAAAASVDRYDHHHNILVAGFGNSLTDVVAYEMVGIARENIFTIDKKSRISCMDIQEQRPLLETIQADLKEARIQHACEDAPLSMATATLTSNAELKRNSIVSKRWRRSWIQKRSGHSFHGYQDKLLWENIAAKLEANTIPRQSAPRSNTCVF